MRTHPSIFCGSLVLKSIKRSVINIRRSMLGVRCLQSAFGGFDVQSDLCSNYVFHIRFQQPKSPCGIGVAHEMDSLSPV